MITRRLALSGIASLALPGIGVAQDRFPSRPIRIINPYGPGGASDIISRLVADQMRELLGQPVIVENRPGAGGLIAAEVVARAQPDGHTIMIGNTTTNVLTPLTFRGRPPVDVFIDMAAITRMADLPAVFAVTKDFGPRTMREVIDYAKRHPGDVKYPTPGVATYAHFDMELLAKRNGVEFTHLPMPRGAAPILSALMRNDAQFITLNPAALRPVLESGAVLPIAVTSHERMPEFPNVPTMAEAGFPGIGSISWVAMFAPQGLPPAATTALHRSITQALRAEAVLTSFRRQIITAAPSSTPDDAKTWLMADVAYWRRLIAETGIELAD
ncbi:Bug family tripartite tricarboxylate transporter substrate binding protein [Roseomonas fluvialis]|uniref:MFS transporter n=1 Tax=Roseomonas fluvialis TaxID=1750527 RepID=A0ABM7Y7S2_9PROT|nr:tripartite tricarboxylate transporter substrate binding protein [Roseomonas fluvialis]BDG74032.1 MFS transporter [Roseomonas fluvialis]